MEIQSPVQLVERFRRRSDFPVTMKSIDPNNSLIEHLTQLVKLQRSIPRN
jgi:hypothetical protein